MVNEYTKEYIVEALFSLMVEKAYAEVSIKAIALKAGVARSTFYRHFITKEDILLYYFDLHKEVFIRTQPEYPLTKEGYIRFAENILSSFRLHKDRIYLIRQARLDYLYLDYLNKNLSYKLLKDYDNNSYLAYAYAGALFNVSMAWLDSGCEGDVATLAKDLVEAINIGTSRFSLN